MKRDRPVQIKDGEWYAVAFRNATDGEDPFTEECCDCGLVHRVSYKVENGKFWVQYIVDRRATTRARARRAKAPRK